jgi:glycosyltransferase involved in cell wall biosynthesis
MSKRTKPKKAKAKRAIGDTSDNALAREDYARARKLAERGRFDVARQLYDRLETTVTDPSLKALVNNDLATLLVLDGEKAGALARLQKALSLDEHCEAARANLALLEAEPGEAEPQPGSKQQSIIASGAADNVAVRVAILSFLFNWPSTGGGNVHTFELALFLARAGYEVKHFYVHHVPWGIGAVDGRVPYASEALDFDEATWNAANIQARFRQAVDAFHADHVIITDSWNFKPLLAEAMQGYPTILRFQAMECLCPLNNVRLLPEPKGRFRQCVLHQLATPEECARCIRQRGASSGSLHRAERALSRAGTPEYYALLRRVLGEAEAVLVVNPPMEAMISPYAKSVRVVTAGMDPARFHWPWPEDASEPLSNADQDLESCLGTRAMLSRPSGAPAGHAGSGRAAKACHSPRSGKPLTLFFAGLVEEWMKGFEVLHQACAQLWQRRRDFELVATGDPPGPVDEFTRFVGWLSQEELPRHLRACGILIMPTIAQEALGRTAVEAMAAARPVIASRIGGLPFTVVDGATGLLFEPGNALDLARKIEDLLDDPELRQRMGQAGRRRFEEHYAWDVIIQRHYLPILGCPVRSESSGRR